MGSKQTQPTYDYSEVITLLRMSSGNSARELMELHHYLRDSPISGDAIRVFTESGLAESLKVCNNEGMDNNTSLRVSPTTVYSESLEIRIPVSLTVHYEDTDFDQVFTWDPETGEYLDKERNALYIEPVNDDGLITSNSYFEVPESM